MLALQRALKHPANEADQPPSGDPEREGVLVYDDPHVVVIDKPAGVSSVPYEERESGTAMDLIRGAWRRMGKPATSVPLHVVHRIDRATSGLLAFAKTKRAEVGLDREEVIRSLESGEYLPNVMADKRQAMAYGIHGVPFFVFEHKYAVSGAQPPEVFLEVLEQVAAEFDKTGAG